MSEYGRYIIKSRLGRGGMGQVYLAYDPDLKREVALKTLSLSEPGRDKKWLQLFVQEVQAAAGLSHPHIVTVHDVGLEHRPPYVVMELLRGETLRAHLLKAGTISWPTALTLLRPIAEALTYAHSLGIIHRDVKPSNVMFAESKPKMLKLVDFGLVRLQDKGLRTDAVAGSGTPGYMSPEQARREAVDGRTDIFALGITLLEVISGRNPLDKGSTLPTIAETVSETPIALSGLSDDIPARLMAIIARCVAKAPAERYPTCQAFLTDLDHCLSELDSGSESLTATQASPAPPIDLATYETAYRQRLRERYVEDAPYFISLAGETTEIISTQSQAKAPRSARRRRQRAEAEYHQWIQTGPEIERIRLETLREGVDRYACIILLGDPGSGKTTTLESLAYDIAGESNWLPVPLRLSAFETGLSIEDFVSRSWGGAREAGYWGAPQLAANLANYLKAGKLFFLLDGLNEMPRDKFYERTQALRIFIDKWSDKGNRFLVTCRSTLR